jgi:hypothetical protein
LGKQEQINSPVGISRRPTRWPPIVRTMPISSSLSTSPLLSRHSIQNIWIQELQSDKSECPRRWLSQAIRIISWQRSGYYWLRVDRLCYRIWYVIINHHYFVKITLTPRIYRYGRERSSFSRSKWRVWNASNMEHSYARWYLSNLAPLRFLRSPCSQHLRSKDRDKIMVRQDSRLAHVYKIPQKVLLSCRLPPPPHL